MYSAFYFMSINYYFVFSSTQQKYFDSGDYNMAKSKGKIGLRIAPIATKPGLPRPIEATTGDTIPTPDAIHLRKTSVQGISNLAV